MTDYWFWEDGLPKELCEMVIKEKDNIIPENSAVGTGGKYIENKKIRDSNLYWLPCNHWVEGILYNYGRYANLTTGWNFKINQPQFIQLTEYGKDGHYDWHIDWDPFSIEHLVRKVSTVCLLNDPSEFEGGEFELEGDRVFKMKQGSVISFPSFLRHRVKPVTSGNRMSAVCWILGDKVL